MKKVAALIEKHGGTAQHLVWIKYFTMPCDLIKNQDTDLSPTDHFLFSFNYVPTQLKTVKKELGKCHNASEIGTALSNLFKFSSIPYLNLFILSKSMIDGPSGTNRTVNIDYVPQFIFRGFIMVANTIKPHMSPYFKGESSNVFRPEYWDLIQFPLMYITDRNELFVDFINIVDPFLSAFSCCDYFLNLSEKNPLHKAFLVIISSILPFFQNEIPLGTTKLLDFLTAALIAIGNKADSSIESQELLSFVNGYLHCLIPVANSLDKIRSRNITLLFSTYLIKILANGPNFSSMIYNFGIDTIELIIILVEHLTRAEIFTFTNGLLYFIQWLTKHFSIEAEFENVDASLQPPQLKFYNFNEYITNNSLLVDADKLGVENEEIKKLVRTMKLFVVKSPNLVKFLFEAYSHEIDKFQDSKIEISCIFFLLFLSQDFSPNVQILNEFINSKTFQDTFPVNTDEITPLAHRFQSIYLCVLFNICSQNEEILIHVLKTIKPLFRNNCIKRLGYFMPLLRSLLVLDAKIQFVSSFIKSGIIEEIQYSLMGSGDEKLINQVAGLYQVMCVLHPIETLTPYDLLPMFYEMILIERLQPMICPCFKTGLSLCHTPPVEKGIQCVVATLKHIMQVWQKAISQPEYHQLSSKLLQYIAESLGTFSEGIYEDLFNIDLFIKAAQIPSIVGTSASYLTTIRFFTQFCHYFPQYITVLNNSGGPIISTIVKATSQIEINREIIDALFCFALNILRKTNNFEKQLLQNRAALKLLLLVAQEANFEKTVLELILQLCNSNISNVFECFSCDVIGFALRRLTNDESLISIVIPLFNKISSNFFSTLSLNEIFRAMRVNQDGKKSIKHQILIDSLLSLMLDDVQVPVSSFFHFNEIHSGIWGSPIDGSFLNLPFAFATTIRQEGSSEQLAPIMSITENANSFFSLFVHQQKIGVLRKKSSGEEMVHFDASLVSNMWYMIVVIFNLNETVQLYINNELVDTKPLEKISIVDRVVINIGCFKEDSFSGDIGPSFFIESSNYPEIYQKLIVYSSDHIQAKNAICKFLPWSTRDNIVLDIYNENDTARFVGTAVPYCTTITSVLQFEGSFQHFVPLILLLNHQNVNLEINIDNEQLFHALLQILIHLLSLSIDMQKLFESLGGFQLLAGFFAQVNTDCFTPLFASNLVHIFKILTLPLLKSQMAEFIWLNFDLWAHMSFNFQSKFYRVALLEAIQYEPSAFDMPSLEFILIQVILTLSEVQLPDDTLLFLPYGDGKPPLVKNKFYEFNEDEEIYIKKLQWVCILTIMRRNPSVSTFITILMIISRTKHYYTRLFAMRLVNSFMKNRQKELIVALQTTDSYDLFLKIIDDSNFKIRYEAFRCIFHLGQLESSGAFKPLNSSFKQATLSIIALFKKGINDAHSIFKICFYYIFGHEPIDYKKKNKRIENAKSMEVAVEDGSYGSLSLSIYRSNSDGLNFSSSHHEEKQLLADHRSISHDNFKIVVPKKEFLDTVELAQFPEFIPLISSLSQHIPKDLMFPYVIKLDSCFQSHPKSFEKFFQYDGWPFWFFMLNINSIDSVTNFKTLTRVSANIFSHFITKGSVNIVRNYFNLLHFIELNFFVDFRHYKSGFLKELISHSIRINLPSNIMIDLISFAMIIVLYSFQFDKSNTVPLGDIDHDLLEEIENVLIKNNQIIKINQNFLFVFELQKNEEGKWLDLELAIEICNALMILISIDPNLELSITKYFQVNIFVMFGYLVSLILLSNPSNILYQSTIAQFQDVYGMIRNKIDPTCLRMGISLASVDDTMKSKFMPDDLTYDRNEFEEKLRTESVQCRVEFLPLYMESNINISNGLTNIVYASSTSNREVIHNSFRSFVEGHKKTRQIVALHNHKLATSFIREVTSNGGPWSTQLTAVKWKCKTRIDEIGCKMFFSINRNFDDHRKASALRDSATFDEDEEPKQIMPFKKIMDQNVSYMASASEKIRYAATFTAFYITLTNQYTGVIHVSNRKIVFNGKNSNDKTPKFLEIAMFEIGFIFNRKYLHDDIAFEVFTRLNKSYLFYVPSTQKRNDFYNSIRKAVEKMDLSYPKAHFLYPFRKACGTIVQTLSPAELVAKSRIMKKWQEGKISNYKYILYLNLVGGRSFNDLSQYPIFPWILSNYTSETIDLKDPNNYRDLSKPIGSYNAERLEILKQHMQEMCDDPSQMCLYRSHYSNPHTVIGYLIRLEPFSTLHIKLQDNKYDHPDRLFFSIIGAWNSVTGTSNDFRELIPEFFTTHNFLTNENGFDLGKRNGVSISEVELPTWAKSPHEFIAIHKIALESDYVSEHLNEWIDLMFGVNMRSFECENVFHYFTYTELVKNDPDPDRAMLAKHHCANFGVCPTKLFNAAHGKKSFTIQRIHLDLKAQPLDSDPIAMMNGAILTSNNMIWKLGYSNQLPMKVANAFLFYYSQTYAYILTVFKGSTSINVYSLRNMQEIDSLSHTNAIINCMTVIGHHFIVTGASDCSIYIWSLETLKLIGSTSMHTLPVIEVSGNRILDLIVSMDEEHTIFFSSLLTRKFIHTFKIDIHANSKIFIRITSSGVIVIASSHQSRSQINYYDICGNLMNCYVLKPKATIEAIDMIKMTTLKEILLFSTNMNSISIVDLSNFTVVREIMDVFVPNMLCAIPRADSILVVKNERNCKTMYVLDI